MRCRFKIFEKLQVLNRTKLSTFNFGLKFKLEKILICREDGKDVTKKVVKKKQKKGANAGKFLTKTVRYK